MKTKELDYSTKVFTSWFIIFFTKFCIVWIAEKEMDYISLAFVLISLGFFLYRYLTKRKNIDQ